MTPTHKRLVVVAYSWADGRPRLRIRSPDAASTTVDALGYRLHYRVDEPPIWHCPGRVPFRSGRGDYIDCLNRPQPGRRTCVDCAVAEAMLAGSLHHAHIREADELDTAVDAHLRQPNVLYVAAFGDGSLKVGTSTAGRTTKRLLEQGALTAAIVAKTDDGIVVRQVEDLITEQLGIPQSVGVARKLRGLVAPRSPERLADRLHRATEQVHGLLDRHAPIGVTPTLEPWLNPADRRIRAGRLFPYPADLRRDAHRLIVDDMVGRLAVASSTAGDRFVIDIGRIFGLELELGDFDPVEIVVQDSLF